MGTVKDGTPYMPWSGSEGDAFMVDHCYDCINYKDGECNVLCRAMSNDIIPEWVYMKGKPTCTQEGKEIVEDTPTDPDQLNLFTQDGDDNEQ